MKIVINEKKVRRNRQIGQYTSIGSLIVLIAGFALSFNPALITYSFVMLILGLLFSQIGIYYGNRWGRSPRTDESLAAGLKGLDEKYSLYILSGPIPYLLVGPAGLFPIVPMFQRGVITYTNKRYRQRGINFFNRFFGQENLGRPDLEAQSYQEDLTRFLSKSMEANNLPSIQALIVFTNPKTEVEVDEAPYATLPLEKLKDFIRRKAKEKPLSMARVQAVRDLLPQPEE